MPAVYSTFFNGESWTVVRTKTYRQDVVGTFPTCAAAYAEIDFQESLDRDKERDRRGC